MRGFWSWGEGQSWGRASVSLKDRVRGWDLVRSGAGLRLKVCLVLMLGLRLE